MRSSQVAVQKDAKRIEFRHHQHPYWLRRRRAKNANTTRLLHQPTRRYALLAALLALLFYKL